MPLNSTSKTRLEEVAHPVWPLGADGEPMGVEGNPVHVTSVGTDDPVTVLGPLTDAELRTAPIQVSQDASPWPFYLTDSAGTANKTVDGKLRVSSMTYLQDISEGNVSGHYGWSKIGYVPIGATTETDVWSYGGTVATIPLIATAGVFLFSFLFRRASRLKRILRYRLTRMRLAL